VQVRFCSNIQLLPSSLVVGPDTLSRHRHGCYLRVRSTLKINLMIDPEEGMAYADIRAIARRAEALGFEALYRRGHYASVFDGRDSARLPEPSSTSCH
jgi:hypothetical protein